ncbi:nuclear transport factor 2 family protein [Streptomyces sp. NRRL WC-3549]|uniref:nuclear transport factor 2 family protein n=1 Tax=Streptomyces sp. NRRL WC-3549 TaxID=1463925 RepID=UPI0004CB2DA2|nr:nuclear transport factor 2 family protein [Streptomyces sp. NRRL WC-3549]
MNLSTPAFLDGTRLAEIQQLYHLQSHLIDGGHAADWAATFTPGATFDSPSYPAPVTGTAALTAFAEQFTAACRAEDVVRRHAIGTVAVTGGDGAGALRVESYLQIIATPRGGTPRTERFTTLTDRVVRDGDRWLIATRTVRRDDRPGTDS